MADTLIHPVEHELEVNRSRFAAIALPVRDIDDAYQAMRAQRIDGAHHNAWAYRIGSDYRFNDDGEVGGTAGKPILAAIDGQGLDRVAVRVARWFGGIKLGTGGLARAYGGCAAECLRKAPRQALIEHAPLHCLVDFAQEQMVRNALQAFAGQVLGRTYRADGLHLTVSAPRANLAGLRDALTDLCRGRIAFDDDSPRS